MKGCPLPNIKMSGRGQPFMGLRSFHRLSWGCRRFSLFRRVPEEFVKCVINTSSRRQCRGDNVDNGDRMAICEDVVSHALHCGDLNWRTGTSMTDHTRRIDEPRELETIGNAIKPTAVC